MAYDGILFRTTDMLKWGAGKGSPLTADEIDANMFEFITRIEALETAQPTPAEIVSITMSGAQMTVHLSNGSSIGPVTVPVASMQYQGDWTNLMPLDENDLFSVPQVGMFLVLKAHTTPATPTAFDQYYTVSGSPAYYKVFGEDTYHYDVGFFFPAFPGNGIPAAQAMAAHQFIESAYLPIGAGGSVASLLVAPAVALSFPITKNATTIGSLNFAAGATIGSFTLATATQFSSADRLRLVRPATVDADAEELMVTFKFTRGTM